MSSDFITDKSASTPVRTLRYGGYLNYHKNEKQKMKCNKKREKITII